MTSFLLALAKKLLAVIPVLFAVSLLTFFMVDLVPGDPAAIVLGANATPEQLATVRQELAVNKPPLQRYAQWLGGVLHGDFGRSFVPPQQSVSSALASRLPVTLELALVAMLLSVVIAVPLGMFSAYKAGTMFDTVSGALVFTAIAIPSFLLGLFLVYGLVFHRAAILQVALAGGVVAGVWILARTPRALRSVRSPAARYKTIRRRVTGAGACILGALLLYWLWPSLPREGFVRLTSGQGLLENLRSVFLPALTLALVEIPVLTTVLRSDAMTTLQQDYILLARSKGLPNRRILMRHALRPSAFSLITIVGVSLGRLIGGTVIVETIFGLPGMGSLIVNAVANKDFRMVQGAVLVAATFYVVLNALVDVSAMYLDPRTRRAHA
jgi:peptide/nickel transport system permease protein